MSHHIYIMKLVQSLSHVQLFATQWNEARQASLSITNLQSLLKFMSVESLMPSNHLILSIVDFSFCLQCFPVSGSNESGLHIRCPKYWSFGFSIHPSNEYSGLTSFRMDWLDLLAIQGTLQSLLQTTVQKRQFFGAQLSLYSKSHIHT